MCLDISTHSLAGVLNFRDNCPTTPNPDQRDSDRDGVGDACEPNRAPVAAGQAITVNEDSSNNPITLGASDADGDALTYSVSTPSHGTLTGSAPNFQYTPVPNFDGKDSFTFKANDGKADSNVATVDITVSPVNHPPVPESQAFTMNEDGSNLAVTLRANDADGDSLTYTVVREPSFGTLTGSAPNLQYTPNPDFFGQDSFVYTVTDGNGGTVAAEISIIVVGANDPPILNLIPPQTVTEGTALTFKVEANDVDIGDRLTYSLGAGAPTGASIDPVTGVFSWTPTITQSGFYGIAVEVSDGIEASSTTVAVTVKDLTTATITIVTHVINDNSGTATADQFLFEFMQARTLGSCGGLQNSLGFPVGSESGTPVTVSASNLGTCYLLQSGSWNNPALYRVSPFVCSWLLTPGDSKTCTFTFDDIPQ